METASSEEKPTSEKSPLTMDVPPKSLPPPIPPTLGLPSPDWSEVSDSPEPFELDMSLELVESEVLVELVESETGWKSSVAERPVVSM